MNPEPGVTKSNNHSSIKRRDVLTCLKLCLYSLQAVSTVNLVLKMLQSLAPYPFLPPAAKQTLSALQTATNNIHLPELMSITNDKDVEMAPLTCDLFLIIIVVAGREQVTKNKSWDVHLLVLVLHHRYSFTIVPDRNGVGLTDGGRMKGRMCYRGYINRTWTHTSEMCSCIGPGVRSEELV